MNTTNFNQDFATFSNYLRGFAIKLTNDASLAEDLYQETAFLAFKNRNKFEPGTNMKAWLGTIMRNTYINDYRRKKRRNEVFDYTPNDYYLDSGTSTIQNEGEESMTLAEINKLVDGLDEKFKKPFLMAHEGYQYEEIGQITNAALGTVKSRIFLARKSLQAKIVDLYDGRPLSTTA